MTPQELSKVMSLIEDLFGVQRFYDGTDKQKVFERWNTMFRDDDPLEVNRAVVGVICSAKFPPTVGEIKTWMAESRLAGQPTEMEAWAMVRDAINHSSDMRSATEAYNQLPSTIRKAVGAPSLLASWYKLSDEQMETVIASNIQRSYREIARREAVYYTLPGQLQVKEQWRVKGNEQVALPEPEVTKSIEEIIEEANQHATAHGMAMTPELQEKHSTKVNDFLKPMTEAEKKKVEQRENQKAEQFCK